MLYPAVKNIIKTNYKKLQFISLINRFKQYFSNILSSKYIHIILIYFNYLKNSSKLTTIKIYSSDVVFFVYFTCFLEICINLKSKLKKSFGKIC